jgi:hypothetical protein
MLGVLRDLLQVALLCGTCCSMKRHFVHELPRCLLRVFDCVRHAAVLYADAQPSSLEKASRRSCHGTVQPLATVPIDMCLVPSLVVPTCVTLLTILFAVVAGRRGYL